MISHLQKTGLSRDKKRARIIVSAVSTFQRDLQWRTRTHESKRHWVLARAEAGKADTPKRNHKLLFQHSGQDTRIRWKASVTRDRNLQRVASSLSACKGKPRARAITPSLHSYSRIDTRDTSRSTWDISLVKRGSPRAAMTSSSCRKQMTQQKTNALTSSNQPSISCYVCPSVNCSATPC